MLANTNEKEVVEERDLEKLSIEKLPTAVPEQEKSSEREANRESEQQKTKETSPHSLKTPAAVRRGQTPIPTFKDEIAVKVEKILEEGLSEAYSRLSPVAKQEFKIKGEETAEKITEMLKSTHVKVKKILNLIFEWLKLLPGVNKFFLEQEAKIKADRIIEIKNQEKH